MGRSTPAGPAPQRLRPVFRDRTELAADADLAGRVQGALEQSAYLIVVCSPDAAASRWVDEEIRRFRAVHGQGRILAVIVAGSLGGDQQDCFPPALHYRDEAGERTHVEPIAADLRPGGDVAAHGPAEARGRHGWAWAWTNSCGVDAQRRTRQFAALAAVSFAGMTVMAGLAGAAFLARNEAQRQRAQAQGLIEFMLTDLRKRLEPVGRLDLMDGIGPKALAYYAAQNPDDLDARALSQRADALRLMGEISEQRGHLAEALRAFEAASVTTGELSGAGCSTTDSASSIMPRAPIG